MKRKAFSIVFALVLVLSFSLVTPVPVAAADLEVGPGKTYTTIASAIAAATGGDTILVYTDTYNEHIVVNKALTIQAATGESPIVDGSGSGACFGIYKSGGLSGVTIDGFEIWNATYGIWIYGDGASSTTYNNITFTNNNIHDHINNGILTTDATVNNLTISDSTVDNSGIGISFGKATVVGLTVDGDVITNGNAGLSFFSGSYTNITVSNCYFEGNAWEHIDLGAWGNYPSISNVDISECSFGPAPWAAIYLESNNSNVSVNRNTFCGVWSGIFDDYVVGTFGQIDGENNFWGAPDGPSGAGSGSGAWVSSTVDYDPWATIMYTGSTGPYDNTTNVILEATVSNYMPVNVDFYIDDGYVGTAETVVGIGTLPIGAQLPGVYEVYAKVSCVQSEPVLVVVYDPNGGFVTGGGWIDSPPGAYKAYEVPWNQGFEADTSGWFDINSDWYGLITRVPSGNDGISSSEGGYHAIFEGDVDSGPFSRFDGYRDTWSGTWKAEIDVYLDTEWVTGTGFDYTVAATGADGNHQRDYIFHVTKDTSTGNLLVAGSNNTNFAPREDLENINHYEVATSGWYTFQHVFYDSSGALAVDLNLLDSDGNILFTETRYDASDTIPDEVGGNRYSWFTFINVDDGIATDEHQLFVELTGKATFGFVSKYKKGANIPDGQTEFVFKAGDLNFHSSSYDWLVVTGSNFAKFKGIGTINGEGEYKFQIWAGDNDSDTFRIKIWYEVDDTEIVVYDNGMNQLIGGGNIVIHTSKK